MSQHATAHCPFRTGLVFALTANTLGGIAAMATGLSLVVVVAVASRTRHRRVTEIVVVGQTMIVENAATVL